MSRGIEGYAQDLNPPTHVLFETEPILGKSWVGAEVLRRWDLYPNSPRSHASCTI